MLSAAGGADEVEGLLEVLEADGHGDAPGMVRRYLRTCQRRRRNSLSETTPGGNAEKSRIAPSFRRRRNPRRCQRTTGTIEVLDLFRDLGAVGGEADRDEGADFDRVGAAACGATVIEAVGHGSVPGGAAAKAGAADGWPAGVNSNMTLIAGSPASG